MLTRVSTPCLIKYVLLALKSLFSISEIAAIDSDGFVGSCHEVRLMKLKKNQRKPNDIQIFSLFKLDPFLTFVQS